MANYYLFQDTILNKIPVKNTELEVKPDVQTDTNTIIRPAISDSIVIQVKPKKEYSLSKIDSLFRVLDKRSQETAAKSKPKKTDTTKNNRTDSIKLSLKSSGAFEKNIIDNLQNNGNLNLNIFPGFFKEKTEYKTIGDKIKPYTNNNKYYNNDAFLGLILAIVVFIIFLKTNFTRFFDVLFQSAFNYHLSNKSFRDKNFLQFRFNMFLNSVYLLILSVFIYQGLNFFDIRFNNLSLSYVYVLIIVSVVFFARYIVLNMLGTVFEAKKEFQEYQYNYFLYNRLMALVILPAVFVFSYIPNSLKIIVIYTVICLLIISYILKLIRGLNIIVKKHVLIFYVLLYLCTLEILPVLVGIIYVNRLI